MTSLNNQTEALVCAEAEGIDYDARDRTAANYQGAISLFFDGDDRSFHGQLYADKVNLSQANVLISYCYGTDNYNTKIVVTDSQGYFSDRLNKSMQNVALVAKTTLITPADTLLRISSTLIPLHAKGDGCLIAEGNGGYLLAVSGDYLGYEI